MFLFVVRTVGNERSHDDKNKKPDTVVFLHVAQKAGTNTNAPQRDERPFFRFLEAKKSQTFSTPRFSRIINNFPSEIIRGMCFVIPQQSHTQPYRDRLKSGP